MPTTASSSNAPAVDALDGRRLFFLDWLRIIAVAILVFFHTGMYYVHWDYHVKSPFAGTTIEPLMFLSAPWRMSLLFMVSGAATAYMVSRGVRSALVRRRSFQLLVPLVFGMAVVVPPQSYVEVIGKFGYTGSYLDFLSLYFKSSRDFCNARDCLYFPTWNHLWFLIYLWVYSMIAFGVLRLWPGLLAASGRFVDRWLGNGVVLMVVPALLIFLLRYELEWRWPSTHGLRGDWFNHATYFSLFAAGVAFAASSTVWNRLADLRWTALALALAFWAVLAFGHVLGVPGHAVIAICQWSALVAAFGFARRHLNVDHRWRTTLVESVFPFYILHQTIIVVGSRLMLPLRWPPLVEGPVLVACTFVLGFLGYLAVRQVNVLRPLFGMSRRASPAVPLAGPHPQS